MQFQIVAAVLLGLLLPPSQGLLGAPGSQGLLSGVTGLVGGLTGSGVPDSQGLLSGLVGGLTGSGVPGSQGVLDKVGGLLGGGLPQGLPSGLPQGGLPVSGAALPLVKRSPLLGETVNTLEGGLGKLEATLRAGELALTGDLKNLWESLKSRFGNDCEAILRELPGELKELVKNTEFGKLQEVLGKLPVVPELEAKLEETVTTVLEDLKTKYNDNCDEIFKALSTGLPSLLTNVVTKDLGTLKNIL